MIDHWEGGIYILAVQLLVVALLNLFTRRQQNYFLGVLLLIYVDTLRNGVISSHIQSDLLLVCIANLHLNFLLGPAIYLYMCSLIHDVPTTKVMRTIGPPLLLIILIWTYGLMMHYEQVPYVVNIYLYEIKSLVIITYLILSLKIIYIDERWQSVRGPRRYKLFVSIFGAFLTLGGISLLLYKYQVAPTLSRHLYTLDQGLYLLMYLYLIYYGITELSWLKRILVSGKTVNSATPSDLDKIAMRIHELTQVHKVHTQPELTMGELAQSAEISVTHLREYLERYAHQSYYEFINEKRVEEFKSKVNDPAYSHLDLMGIAHAAGFNSKATFYRAFKKMEGITPSQYRRNG